MSDRDSRTQAIDTVLVEQIAQVTAGMTPDGEPVTPEALVGFARAALPHAAHSGLTLLREGRAPRTVAASDRVPLDVDALQYRLLDGPCLEAATGPEVVRSGDVGTDGRWPEFGPACVAATGIHSMLGVRLPLGGSDHAALNFYSTQIDAFSDDDLVTSSILAPFAALVLVAHLRLEDVRNLNAALDTSRTISTAVGIIMATRHCSRDEAFQALRRASMDLNAKLRDVASEVEFTGSLPDTTHPLGGADRPAAAPNPTRPLPADPSTVPDATRPPQGDGTP